MLSFPKLFKATVQLLQSFNQLPAYFFSKYHLNFSCTSCVPLISKIKVLTDYLPQTLLSPLGPQLAGSHTPGNPCYLSIPLFIFLSLPLSFYQATFSSFYLFITHLFFNQAISPISLYHQETSSACEIFKKKIKINPLF